MNGKREEKETNNNHVQASKRSFCDKHFASNLNQRNSSQRPELQENQFWKLVFNGFSATS